MSGQGTAFQAEVVDIRLQHRSSGSEVWQMALDQTGFQPGQAGVLRAETRAGTRLSIKVTGVVQDADGVLWHIVEKPLAAGTPVIGSVDASAAGPHTS